jgi:hypothetical protein
MIVLDDNKTKNCSYIVTNRYVKWIIGRVIIDMSTFCLKGQLSKMSDKPIHSFQSQMIVLRRSWDGTIPYHACRPLGGK